MSISAVERTPLEIWRLILQYAVASPILPFVNENRLSTDLIESLHLFSTKCHHYRNYRDTTLSTLERLRLVCRTWANLLQDNSRDFALSDLESHHFTPEQTNKYARRVHLWTWTVCGCMTFREMEMCDYNRGLSTIGWKHKSEDEQSLQRLIPNVRILLWDWPSFPSLKFLGPLSNLTALSLDCDKYADHAWSLEQLRVYTPRLTHLHLKHLNEMSRLLSEKFSHPTLRYLSLEIQHCYDMTSCQDILNWTLPALETFRISGVVHPQHTGCINTFLFRHAKNLDGLDISYLIFDPPHYTPGHIPPNLWNICPKLTRMGITGRHIANKIELLGKEQGSHGSPSIELLHHGVFDDYEPELSELVSTYQGLIRRWNVARIVSADPWNTHLETGVELFRQLAEIEHIPIIDQFYVPIQDALEQLGF
ncbi:hypothetical protein CPB86DRAFT_875318 [Serendipita vermifera]|nr:hypothetical protein CPB86DRAFT_875318 [Serendipita vermifera]